MKLRSFEVSPGDNEILVEFSYLKLIGGTNHKASRYHRLTALTRWTLGRFISSGRDLRWPFHSHTAPDVKRSNWNIGFMDFEILWRWKRKSMTAILGCNQSGLHLGNDDSWPRWQDLGLWLRQQGPWWEPQCLRANKSLTEKTDILTISTKKAWKTCLRQPMKSESHWQNA